MELRFPSPNVHLPSAASQRCPVNSASTESTISFFSAGATTLYNSSGICLIVSLASPTILIAVLLCLFVSSGTHFNILPISLLLRYTWKPLINEVTVASFTEAIFNKKFSDRYQKTDRYQKRDTISCWAVIIIWSNFTHHKKSWNC